MKIVRVEWLDAHHEGDWCEPDLAAPHDLQIVLVNESVGFLFFEAEDRIVIVQSCAAVSAGGHVADRLLIPRPCILKLEVLRDG